ncbi:MAG: hypothetical protein HC892_10740 [Saprospiraceae bacterium]|nr:hypothetical protein [Saprospiraceae bacterium]
MERKGLVNRSGQRIDMLDYSYFNGRLYEIEESWSGLLGFKTLATSDVAQCDYDNNGNMTSDGHKGSFLMINL